MRTLCLSLLSVFIIMAVSSCGGRGRYTPRPEGYPRIELYDSVYSPVRCGDMTLEVNASAESSVENREDGTVWLTVRYPRYGSTVALTLRRVSGEELEADIANRKERIGRNLGESPAVTREVRGDTVVALIVEAQSRCVTPLNVIATDGESYLLSGAMYVDDGEEVDMQYIEPVVEAVKHDLYHMLKNL